MKTICSILIISAAVLHAGESRAAEVKKTAIRGQPFVADFYDTAGATNQPGVLFLGGSEGGRPQPYLPQFFAENGYPVLALAYFKEKTLPETLQLISLDYFDRPIQWMQKNEKMSRGGIILVGASKGAELALLLASKNPGIKGVIALSPSSVAWDGLPKSFWPPNPCSSWSTGGKPVPFVPYDYSKGFAAGDPRAIYKFYQQSLTQTDAVEKAAIAVEKIRGPVLLASGSDDQLWPAEEMGDAICARLKKKGFKYPYEHLKYQGAGHTLNEYFMLGGSLEDNRRARMDLSDKMLIFLKALDQSPGQPED